MTAKISLIFHFQPLYIVVRQGKNTPHLPKHNEAQGTEDMPDLAIAGPSGK